MKKTVVALSVLCALCAACSSRDSLKNRGPDEYLVLSNPPLVLPPDFTLRAPEKKTVAPASETIGKKILKTSEKNDKNLSVGEKAFLQKTGKGDENIEAVLNEERQTYEEKTPVLDKKLKNNPAEETLDASKEAAALREKGVKTTGR